MEQPPFPSPLHMHTHFVLSVEPLHVNVKIPSDKIFFLRASEGNLPQVVVSEILAFLTWKFI